MNEKKMNCASEYIFNILLALSISVNYLTISFNIPICRGLKFFKQSLNYARRIQDTEAKQMFFVDKDFNYIEVCMHFGAVSWFLTVCL